MVYPDCICFIPALCIWHLAPRAPDETQHLLSECNKCWKPLDIKEKRLIPLPPWFKSFCLYSLMQTLSSHWVLYEIITFMCKLEEKKFLSCEESDVTILLGFGGHLLDPVNWNSRKWVLSWYLIFCGSAAGGEKRLAWVYSNLCRDWIQQK